MQKKTQTPVDKAIQRKHQSFRKIVHIIWRAVIINESQCYVNHRAIIENLQPHSIYQSRYYSASVRISLAYNQDSLQPISLLHVRTLMKSFVPSHT